MGVRSGVQGSLAWMDRRQVSLYLAALVAGAVVGLVLPAAREPAAAAITPVLALMLYSTFLGVPFGRIGRAVRDGRFLATVLAVNFVVAPAVVFLLSRTVAHDPVLLVGVLLVLLTPCVDYVIVFAGLAGGAADRLVAAAPLLMLIQFLLLPLYLWAMAGPEFVGAVEIGPFVEAFVLLILLPLCAAWLTQAAASRSRAGQSVQRAGLGAMVPLMMLTLATVVASQISGVSEQLGGLMLAVPVYVLFAAVMVLVGMAAGRVARLDVPARRAVLFSGVTRNSLVVLPLALAMPAGFDLVPLVVVTQTLVELVIMVLLVRTVPRLVRGCPVRTFPVPR